MADRQAPKVNDDGSIQEGVNVRILDQRLFVNNYPTLPTVSEWALGSASVTAHGTVLRGSAADPGNPQTFFGWPMAINSNDGLTGCLGPHPDSYSTFEVHSPVNLLFTDPSGKRYGTDAKGNRIAELAGTLTYDGEVRTYILPKAAYTVTIAATGKGPVAIRSDAANGITTARFTVKKGQKATVSLKAGAPLGAFKIGGVAVKPVKGSPLLAVGLPKRVKAGRASWRARLRILDSVGEPVPNAYLVVRGMDDTDATVFADAEGKLDAYVIGLAAGRNRVETARAGLQDGVRADPRGEVAVADDRRRGPPW